MLKRPAEAQILISYRLRVRLGHSTFRQVQIPPHATHALNGETKNRYSNDGHSCPTQPSRVKDETRRQGKRSNQHENRDELYAAPVVHPGSRVSLYVLVPGRCHAREDASTFPSYEHLTHSMERCHEPVCSKVLSAEPFTTTAAVGERSAKASWPSIPESYQDFCSFPSCTWERTCLCSCTACDLRPLTWSLNTQHSAACGLRLGTARLRSIPAFFR